MAWPGRCAVVEMPDGISRLPVDRGYPVPFFAAVIDGKPDIRRVSAAKFHRCIKERLCWLCGEGLGEEVTFVLPVEALQAGKWTEPPCHLECARYAMAVCPFILNPERAYRSGTKCPGEYALHTTTFYECGPLGNRYPIGVITLGPAL